ncbi:transport and Golgi organization protein 1 homolog isoform X1 [Meles meles]|uniref:transport and Golgi organization protein 1 homolog isoform X1 n=2 Tax=Meles meles TaxID=9662 RepID=UPI001E69FDB8|nr:transport and Golgi organization protein 1 homolog isoform X1 [Meles meles]
MVVEFSERRKLTAEEQQVEEMQDQQQETELTFNHKIAVQERNALANWMKARYWETRMMQQSRENAYLKYRLRMMEGEMMPGGSMRREQMPGRPELQKPVWQAPRPVPRMNSRTSPQRDPLMATVGRGVRVFPHCPGPLRMPYHMGRNVPGFPPPHPPPQWWAWGPQPHLVPPPHGTASGPRRWRAL